jgi:MFS family permease
LNDLCYGVEEFHFVVLGAAEAGYYPCVMYYLAFWLGIHSHAIISSSSTFSLMHRFKPEEMAYRVAVFFSFGQFAGFVGGFLAFAISFADGRLAGWRWLFIIGWTPQLSSIAGC